MMESIITGQDRPDVATRRRRGSGSPGNGGPRRPGNLWTLEAREEMFRRREAGEGWETICLDYPRRSRHAMQQQYSMMKKQQAMANGTWVSGRRGRKRKGSSGDKWASATKQQPKWDDYDDDDETEEDDFDEAEPMDSEDAAETTKDSQVPKTIEALEATPVFRPPLPVRSATEPVFRPTRSKIVTFPHHSNSAESQIVTFMQKEGPDSSKTSTDNELGTRVSNTLAYPHKRRKCSPSALKSSSIESDPTAASMTLEEEDVLGLQEQISQILHRVKEKSRATALDRDAELSLQRRAFEDSVSRANRRADEAQDKLRQAHYEFAEALKAKESQHAEALRIIQSEYAGAVKLAEEAHTKEINEMAKRLIAQEKRLNEAGKSVESSNKLSQKQQLSASEEQRRILVQQANQIRALHSATVNSVAKAYNSFQTLSTSLDRLKDSLEDMSMKAITKAVTHLISENMEAQGWMEQAMTDVKAASMAASTNSDGHGTDGMQGVTNGAGSHKASGTRDGAHMLSN